MRLGMIYLPLFMALGVFSHSLAGITPQPQNQSALKNTARFSILHKSETIKFPMYAPRAISLQNHCDSSGNIFLLFAPSHANPLLKNVNQFAVVNIMNQPIHEFKILSQNVIAFGGPELSNLNDLPGSFTVSGDDHVFRILEPNAENLNRKHPKDVIYQYDPDGSLDSIIHLHVPHHWEFDAGEFIVFGGGNYMVTGLLHPWMPPPRPGQKPTRPVKYKPFTAIFDEQGNLISAVHLPGDQRAGTKPPLFWPRVAFSTLMAPGPDDTAYLLRPRASLWLYTLSSDGRVLREVKVDTSQFPSMQLVSLNSMGNSQLFLQFLGMKTDARHDMHLVNIFAVVDVATGNILQAYRMPSGRGAMFACASDPHHIEYLSANRKGKLEVSIYSSP